MYKILIILILYLLSVSSSCSKKPDTDDQQNSNKIALSINSDSTNSQDSITKSDSRESVNLNIWDRISQKGKWFENGETIQYHFDSIKNDFNLFYDRFISDSLYQINHINFPIVGAIGYCESTEIPDSNNWELITFDFRKNPDYKRYGYDLISTEDKFFLRSRLNEVGLISEIGFEKIEGEWQLTMFFVNAC